MLKNGVEKHASDIIEYPFFIRYLSARNYWFHDYAYNTMFFGINMNIMLYSFELIFFNGFDVYRLLIFTVIALSLMMSASNGWQGNITKLLPSELLGRLLLRRKK
ncbi:hypothetical protein ACEPFB_000720 [Salmonella enterica]|nr:hypothetical protein [Salmonella enterica]EDW0650980.1 hypothetical protein [Salmonella enterica subsp. enterica serovar Weslaco]EJU7755749.1 hypothetical protein [Salmonella enterica subsp. enterica serovar 11:b:1,7]EBR7328335.1 hypothetical protein [Salmonella enterica]ECZ6302634.1 hypothetical protein [Salmonella enterica]